VKLPLAVVGVGLASPLGLGAEQHAFFARAGEGPAAPGGFVTADGENAPVHYCPWLGADLPRAERLSRLGADAARLAFAEVKRVTEGRAKTATWVVGPAATERSDPGAALALGVGARGGAAARLVGAAELFRALEQASDALARGDAELALVVGGDSLVELELLREHRALVQSPWGPNLPDASEGAAAFALAPVERARALGLDVWAVIHEAAVRVGASHDDNDEVVDGAALTRVVRDVSARKQPFRAAFGPLRVDSLRRREWDLMQARTATLWGDPELYVGCAERELGFVGEASGAMNLGLLLACLRHGALPDALERPLPQSAGCLAWAISKNGLRGAALVTGERTRHHGAAAPRQGTLGERPVRLAVGATLGVKLEAPLEEPEGEGEGASDEAELPDPRIPTEDTEAPSITRGATGEGAPLPIEARAREVLGNTLDRLAMLLRHRWERPTRDKAEAEAHALAQLDALAALGASPAQLMGYVEDEGIEDAWVPGAAAVALAALESLGAEDETATLVELARALPRGPGPDDGAALDEAVVTLGRALGYGPLRDGAGLAKALVGQRRPAARAVGLELSGRLGSAGHELFVDRLRSNYPPVERRAAARALARLPRDEAAVGALRRAFVEAARPSRAEGESSPGADGRLATLVGRALLVLGDRTPLGELRLHAETRAALAEGAVELFALGGSLEDVRLVEEVLSGLDPSPQALCAVARLGHPGSWAFLAHYLDDDERSDAAHDALSTLFGPLLGELEPSAERWAKALARAGLPDQGRLRGGKAWSGAAVLAEVASGALSLEGVSQRADELRAQVGRAPDEVLALAREA
jgi:hypothetical protein